MDAFAPFVRTLGRGPGRSRPLTRQEAAEAFGLVLAGEVDPHQVGAFLMLLRYRGEDADEVTGLVEAAREAIGTGKAGPETGGPHPDLDWPSYGSGRTRGAPWYLLAALALGRTGTRVLMHGSNEFTGGTTVKAALDALDLAPATDRMDALRTVERTGFAYLPLDRLSPALARLIELRRLLGLRSPVNTVGRLLDPADAGRSVDGVFHPAYIDLHLAVAERLGRTRLAVVKGGGGEAERAPGKRLAVHTTDRVLGRSVLELPPLLDEVPPMAADREEVSLLRSVWAGDTAPSVAVATVVGTIALALHALEPDLRPEDADRQAAVIWAARRD